MENTKRQPIPILPGESQIIKDLLRRIQLGEAAKQIVADGQAAQLLLEGQFSDIVTRAKAQDGNWGVDVSLSALIPLEEQSNGSDTRPSRAPGP